MRWLVKEMTKWHPLILCIALVGLVRRRSLSANIYLLKRVSVVTSASIEKSHTIHHLTSVKICRAALSHVYFLYQRMRAWCFPAIYIYLMHSHLSSHLLVAHLMRVFIFSQMER
jgi:hypothetical protein